MPDLRAHVQNDWARMGVAVTVVQRAQDRTLILEPDPQGFDSWRQLDPATVYEGASYRFSDDVAKALLEALLDHYRGGHDARQLRKDYTDERARVDKMLAALIEQR